MAYFEDYAPEAHRTPVRRLVDVENRAALDLHARLGFREIGRAPGFAGVTFTGGEPGCSR